MIARALVALALLLAAGTSHAFELMRINKDPCRRNEQNLFWRSEGIGVSVAFLEPPYDELAVEAWQLWNDGIERFRFRDSGGNPCTRDGVAAFNIGSVACENEPFGDAVALTLSKWNGEGALVDADITFKDDTFVLEDDDIFRQVAMHELGHVLGLDHSDACGASGEGTLMRRVLVGPILSAPQADDINGANAIYPRQGGGDGTVPDGANSCAIVPAPRAGGDIALPWVAMILLLLWRRIRPGN